MPKIHTHYDNLKVAPGAPPEVIRAAYKALSQKYHPDKNPGDEKSARIMAILNTAYATLSDTQRRKEHDEWISSEDWEVKWLEEEQKGARSSVGRWDNSSNEVVLYRPSRDPKWWAILLVCVGLGWLISFLIFTQPEFLSMMGLPSKQAGLPPIAALKVDAVPAKIAENRVVVVSQFRLPETNAQCGGEPRATTAPNGAAWPAQSGYIEGYKVGNLEGDTQLTIDNSHNSSDSFVKVFDIEENQIVRYLLIKARQKFTVEQLKTGNYEVQPQILAAESCENPVASTAASSMSALSTTASAIASAPPRSE